MKLKDFSSNRQLLDISSKLLISSYSVYNIFWLFVGAYHSFPTAEDYVVLSDSKEMGIIGGAINMLLTYDGRYTVDFLHGLNPLMMESVLGYRLMSIFTFILFVFSINRLLHYYYKNKKIDNIIYSAGIVTSFYAVLDLPSSFYWMICTFVYIYPIIFFSLFYLNFMKFLQVRKKRFYSYSVVFLILSLGSLELFIPIVGLILILMFYQNRQDKERRYALYSISIIFIACSILFVSSPGIAFRYQRYSADRLQEVSSILHLSWQHLSSSMTVSGIYSLIAVLFLFSINYIKKTNSKTWLLMGLLGVLSVYFIWVLMTLMKGNDGFPVRIIPAPMFLFILSFLIISSYYLVQQFLLKYYWMLIVFLFFSFITNEDSYSKIKRDYINGSLAEFKALMDYNYIQIDTVRKTKDKCYKRVFFKDVSHTVPSSIYIGYQIILPNRGDERWNSGYEKFYNIDEVSLLNDTLNLKNSTYEALYKL